MHAIVRQVVEILNKVRSRAALWSALAAPDILTHACVDKECLKAMLKFSLLVVLGKAAL